MGILFVAGPKIEVGLAAHFKIFYIITVNSNNTIVLKPGVNSCLY